MKKSIPSKKSEVSKKGMAAKKIVAELSLLSTNVKNKALQKMAQFLRESSMAILKANQKDLKNARANKMSTAFLDRLTLNTERIEAMAQGLESIVQLADPIGELLEAIERPNGIKILKRRVPIGVIGIIFEARPNVTVDAAGLCFKTGNAVILRGGSDAIESNKAIIKAIRLALNQSGLPADAVQLLENTDRKLVTDFLTADEYLDLIIPRGSHSLIQRTVKEATVPTIETGEGNCHIYVHEKADLEKTLEIIYNAKVQRPSVCNAVESLVIDEAVAEKFVPAIVEKLSSKVTLVGDTLARKYSKVIGTATEEDWGKEYSDYKLSIKIVKNIKEAIAHISYYHTQHSDCIMTEDQEAAAEFMQSIDSCAVLHNASTRFVDGGEFGFGAEIGISTQKIHARGPMGLKEITSYKYFVYGDGQVRS